MWAKSYANELGRLTQVIRDIPDTNTMFFIKKSDVPVDRRKNIRYGRIVVTLRPQKSEEECRRLTVGGNLIDYPWEVTTPTADLTTAKLLFNSIISTPRAVFGNGLQNFLSNDSHVASRIYAVKNATHSG